MLLLTSGSIFGIYHWIKSIETSVPATSGTVMLAAMPILLGFQLFLSALTYDIFRVPSRPIQKR